MALIHVDLYGFVKNDLTSMFTDFPSDGNAQYGPFLIRVEIFGVVGDPGVNPIVVVHVLEEC